MDHSPCGQRNESVDPLHHRGSHVAMWESPSMVSIPPQGPVLFSVRSNFFSDGPLSQPAPVRLAVATLSILLVSCRPSPHNPGRVRRRYHSWRGAHLGFTTGPLWCGIRPHARLTREIQKRANNRKCHQKGSPNVQIVNKKVLKSPESDQKDPPKSNK